MIEFLKWFSGGHLQYHVLHQCMQNDWFWLILIVVLDLSNVLGYLIIAYHWFVNQKVAGNTSAKKSLSRIRQVFILCGCCGYLFTPLEIFWPAWRLLAFALLWLNYYTWRYAWASQEQKVIYTEIAEAELSNQKLKYAVATLKELKGPLNDLSDLIESGVLDKKVSAVLSEVLVGTLSVMDQVI